MEITKKLHPISQLLNELLHLVPARLIGEFAERVKLVFRERDVYLGFRDTDCTHALEYLTQMHLGANRTGAIDAGAGNANGFAAKR